MQQVVSHCALVVSRCTHRWPHATTFSIVALWSPWRSPGTNSKDYTTSAAAAFGLLGSADASVGLDPRWRACKDVHCLSSAAVLADSHGYVCLITTSYWWYPTAACRLFGHAIGTRCKVSFQSFAAVASLSSLGCFSVGSD